MASPRIKKSYSINSYSVGRTVKEAFDTAPPVKKSSLTPVVEQPKVETPASVPIRRPVPPSPSGFSPFGITTARSFSNVDLSGGNRFGPDKQLSNLDKYFPGFVPPIITPRQYVNLQSMEYTPVYLPMRFSGFARVSSEHGLGTNSGLLTDIKQEKVRQQTLTPETFQDRNEKLLKSRSQYSLQQSLDASEYSFKPSIQKDIKYPPPQKQGYKRINSYSKLHKRKKQGKRAVAIVSDDEESDIERLCAEFNQVKTTDISYDLNFSSISTVQNKQVPLKEGVPEYMQNLYKASIVPVEWEVKYEQGFDNEGLEQKLQQRHLFGKAPPQVLRPPVTEVKTSQIKKK